MCQRDVLLQDPCADRRVLLLTREEEKKLLLRLEAISSLADLRRMQHLLYVQLGIVLHVQPGPNEVRSVRGLHISLEPRPGLCRKTAQAVLAAVRRGLEAHLQIVYDLLDEGLLPDGQASLFGSGS